MNIYLICVIILGLIVLLALILNGIEDHKTHNISFDESLKLTNMPIVSFKHGKRKINFLVDTGSDFSYIDESIVKHLKIKDRNNSGNNIITANGYMETSGNIIIELTHDKNKIDGEFTIGNIKDAMDAAFAPRFIVRGILGSIFLKKYKYMIDYNNNEIKYKRRKSGSKVSTLK